MVHYILVDSNVIPVPLPEWIFWFETADRTIAKTQVGESMVSTVFLGIDHSFGFRGTPILFETLVFGGLLDDEMERYATLKEARLGHEQMIARVRASAARG